MLIKWIYYIIVSVEKRSPNDNNVRQENLQYVVNITKADNKIINVYSIDRSCRSPSRLVHMTFLCINKKLLHFKCVI